jgi:antitoxin (DNA-binding transcriptional repressor) of toxin-antitoxin stability system
MKTLTTREFFHSPGLMKSLQSGQSVVVTDHGKSALLVTKAARRPRRKRIQLEREALEICPEPNSKVNFTSALKDLKSK